MSLFLDWYTYQVLDKNDNIIANWNYKIFIEWYTPLSEEFTLNDIFKPNPLGLSPILHFTFIGILLACAFIALRKDVEQAESPQKFKNFAYINLTLLLFIGFYVIIFPVMYLLPNDLYFPYLLYEDPKTNISYVFLLNSGYYFQVIAFALTFPYSIFYYYTIIVFEQRDRTIEKVINKIIEAHQEPLDIDKFIAEEELEKQPRRGSLEEDAESIYNKFIEQRARK